MKTYFNDLLDTRNLGSCPLPLWKLKLTEAEFERLRSVLKERTHLTSTEDVFKGFERECTLYFAEFWRREYNGDDNIIKSVYSNITSDREHGRNFYQAAIKGAQKLKIDIYENENGDHQYLRSIMYQGGLPMKLVTGGKTSGRWNNFTHGLVNRHINYDGLDLGVVAAMSSSMRLFCERIMDAIEAEQYMLMPFYCEDETNSWYVYLLNLARQEKNRRQQQRPFSLDWEFTLDQNAKKLFVKYIFKGAQHLSSSFVEEHHLDGLKFFTTQVRVDGKVVDSFDYFNFYSYNCNNVECKHLYNDGESVAFYINNAAEPHLADELDMGVPHLLYRSDRGAYLLGNRLGKTESAVVFSDTWTLDNKDITTEVYTWHDAKYTIAFIPEGYVDVIHLHGDDGKMDLSSTSKMVWTEYNGASVNGQDVYDPLYDASKLAFFLCKDGEKDFKTNDIEFRGIHQREWQTSPLHGRIKARVRDVNGLFVTPTEFINIGAKEDLVITCVSETEYKCMMRVWWKHGKVKCENGKCVNEQWRVKKEDCENYKIRFTLIPKDNNLGQFTIQVKAPFKEFAILDMNDKLVRNNSWVPFVDVDKYRYHIVGDCVKQYSYGGVVRKLSESAGRLRITEKDTYLKNIPIEDCLTRLFDSRGVLRAMLDKTSEDIIHAAVDFQFITTRGGTLSFTVKDSPYRIRTEGDRIIISSNGGERIDYRGTLKLLKLDDPQQEPREVLYDDETGYVVPKDVYAWGKMIVVGSTKGRICPGLIDMTQELTSETRVSIREEAINRIKEEIAASTLGDAFWTRVLGWYKRIWDEGIPASSLLEFKCISEDPVALLCLTFQLYAQCTNDEDKDTLANRLLAFSSDLAFQWYWLKMYIPTALMSLSKKINSYDNGVVCDIFINWAMQQENPMQYLTTLGQMPNQPLEKYQEWLKDLAVKSLLERYDDTADDLSDVAEAIVNNTENCYTIKNKEETLVEIRQDRSERISPFFDKYAEGANLPENELWLRKRTNVVAAHMRGKLDLFNLPEDVSDGVRRSVIFCAKACNHKFIIELNNKLAR